MLKGRSNEGIRNGFVIGELLVAVLLLAVAVSSLAALMYSVSTRRPADEQDKVECVGKAAPVAGKCAPAPKAVGGPSKLLRDGCATRLGSAAKACQDSLVSDSSGEVVLKPRTDSAAMALLEKKQKASQPVERPDRGFIR